MQNMMDPKQGSLKRVSGYCCWSRFLWDEKTQFFYDRYFNGTMMTIKTIAGFYPLLADGIPQKYLQGMVKMLKVKDFATAVSHPHPILTSPSPNPHTPI